MGGEVPIPLRERQDLPPHVAHVLGVDRTRNPWTDVEARVIAEFCGYTPSIPYPGWREPWPGVCHVDDAHAPSPALGNLLKGQGPCRPCGKKKSREVVIPSRPSDGVRKPLRDRDDLPPKLVAVLSQRRSVARPWTEEDALIVCDYVGFIPKEPFQGRMALWLGECREGHPVQISLHNVLNGSKPCLRCSFKERGENRAERSLAKVTQGYADLGWTVVDSWIERDEDGASRQWVRVQTDGCGTQVPHIFVARQYDLASQQGCAICSGSQIQLGVNDLASQNPDIAAELIEGSASELTLASSKVVRWRCSECGYEWRTAVKNRTSLGTGCSECTRFGFTRTQPTALYVVNGVTTFGVQAIKFGIANTVGSSKSWPPLRRRLYVHKRNGLGDVLRLERFSSGEIPLAAETEVKAILASADRPSYVTRLTRDDIRAGHMESIVDNGSARSWLMEVLSQAVANASERFGES